MPTLTGQVILDRAWIKAQDTGGVRWPSAEGLLWLNDGQREVVNVLPSAYTLTTIAAVQAGTRQTLAGLGLASAITTVDIPRNFAVDGTTPGRSVTLRKREWFDEQRPNWHTEVGTEAVHWCMDPRDPKAFYIFPAIAGAAGKLEVVHSASPPDLVNVASVITLDDIYANALQWFVLFSFYSKDATYTQNPAKASGYYQLFLQSLGQKGNATLSNALAAGQASSIGNGK